MEVLDANNVCIELLDFSLKKSTSQKFQRQGMRAWHEKLGDVLFKENWVKASWAESAKHKGPMQCQAATSRDASSTRVVVLSGLIGPLGGRRGRRAGDCGLSQCGTVV
jgi:hypothetical protein